MSRARVRTYEEIEARLRLTITGQTIGSVDLTTLEDYPGIPIAQIREDLETIIRNRALVEYNNQFSTYFPLKDVQS